MQKTFNELVNLWNEGYCFFIPASCCGASIWLKVHDKCDVFSMKSILDAVGGVITADSIIISLFGIMLTLLADSKEKSALTKEFFNRIDRTHFIRIMRRCVLTGILSIASSVGIYFIQSELVFLAFICWLFLFLSMLCQTYRMISLIIGLLFSELPESQSDGDIDQREIEQQMEQMNELIHSQEE